MLEMDLGETLEIEAMREIGVGHMIGSLEIMTEVDNRSVSNSRSRSGSRACTNRDRIRCFKCRDYNYFVRDYPTTQADREVEQIQQMFNMDEDQTLLQIRSDRA